MIILCESKCKKNRVFYNNGWEKREGERVLTLFHWISAPESVVVPGMTVVSTASQPHHLCWLEMESDGSSLPRRCDCPWGNTKISPYSIQILINHEYFITINLHMISLCKSTTSVCFNTFAIEGLTCQKTIARFSQSKMVPLYRP